MAAVTRRAFLKALPALALPPIIWPPSVTAKPKRTAEWWLPLLGWVDVRRYGTDRAAIERARDAAGSKGTLYFSAGLYVADWDVEATIPGQRWIISRDATIRRANGSTDQWSMGVIRVKAAGVTIEGAGTIDANRAGTDPQYAIACVLAERQDDLTVQDVALVNCHGTAAVAYSDQWGASNRATFRRLRVRAAPSGIGWIWGACVGGTAEDNDLILDGAYANGIGAALGAQRLTIQRNRIRGARRFGIELWNGCHDSDVLGNTLEGPCEMGISVAGSDNCGVLDNTVTGASYAGIELAAAPGVSVNANTLTGCAVGIMVDATRVADVFGNTVNDSQRAVMTLNAADVLVDQNTLDGWSGGHAPSAVYLQNSRGVQVTRNDLSHGPGACIAVDGSHDVAVTDNTYHDLDGDFGVWTWGDVTGLTVNGNHAV